MNTCEKNIGKVLKQILRPINSIKKLIVKTECKVHIFNNIHAVDLLKKYGYEKEYTLFHSYLKYLNKGSVWADQDFKSINHFYNPYIKRGLFGHSNSLRLTGQYYALALKYWSLGKRNKAMFYLGACIHIVQDLTIPQHVAIRLLGRHRSYENFVKYTYNIVKEYICEDPPILFDDITTYIEFNSRTALKIEKHYRHIKNKKLGFHYKTLTILPLAQSTTAGCFVLFYKDIQRSDYDTLYHN